MNGPGGGARHCQEMHVGELLSALTKGFASFTMWSASSSVMKLWKTKARGRHDTGSTLAGDGGQRKRSIA